MNKPLAKPHPVFVPEGLKFSITVPQDYVHKTAIASLIQQLSERRNHPIIGWPETITDENVPDTFNELVPGETLRVGIYRQDVEHTTTPAHNNFLDPASGWNLHKDKVVIRPGIRGVFLAFLLAPGRIPLGYKYICVDDSRFLPRVDDRPQMPVIKYFQDRREVGLSPYQRHWTPLERFFRFQRMRK